MVVSVLLLLLVVVVSVLMLLVVVVLLLSLLPMPSVRAGRTTKLAVVSKGFVLLTLHTTRCRLS